jgi:hypothetical protein
MLLGSKLQHLGEVDCQDVFATLLPNPVPIYQVELPHHKMDKIHQDPTLSFPLPYPLGVAVHLYLEMARPVLMGLQGAQHNKLLVNPISGKPLKDENALNRLWRRIQTKYKAPWQPAFPPNDFRAMHVDKQVQR